MGTAREMQERAVKVTGIWVPGNAPLDEGYWQALLSDEEYGGAVVDVKSSTGEEALDHAAGSQPGVGHWQAVQEAMERGDVLELPVLEYNRGGIVVGWNGLYGFVPASQLLSLPPAPSEKERYAALQRLVGTNLRLKVIEVYPEQNRIVLSERATCYDESGRRELLESISPGDVCQGVVSKLCPFGAFVDLGGLEGLVHISELSWGRIDSPDEVLEVGQPVKVYVLDVNRERGRVRLSIKRLHHDPWLSVKERYRVGQMVEGVVTHVVDFGAFVRVEDGLEALLHASEIAGDGFVHPREVLQEGDRVNACVIALDSERRRMGLSLRRAGLEG